VRAAGPTLELQRHLHRDLDAHRAGVGEEHLVEAGRGDLDELRGEPDRRLVGQSAEHDMGEVVDLAAQGGLLHEDLPARHPVWMSHGDCVTKAPEGYETPATTYVVANPTNVFANHFYFDSKVTGELKRGEHVQALAKVKGYDWVLVGKNGMGIGYVPISMLAPENQYRS